MSQPLDYVTKDYEGFLQMMLDNIPNLTPEWTDTSDTDPGIVILKNLAYGLHILGYYEDKATNENILHLARTNKARLALCHFLGYDPKKQKASTSMVSFSKTAEALNEVVVVPAGTKVSTDVQAGNIVIFETDTSITIPSGTNTGSVAVTQGESINGESLGMGDNKPNQWFDLQYPEVLDDSLVINTIENGTEFKWTKVDNLIESLPSDRHYMIELVLDNVTRIRFGDGIFGRKVPVDTPIIANYRFGGGIKGNLAIGKINYLYDSLMPDGILSVTNTSESVGGEDYEDLDRAVSLAPKQYRTGGKAVNPEDFQDLAELVSGVAKAKCVETFNANSDVNLYIATSDYSPASSELLQAVSDAIIPVMVMNQNLNVYTATYVAIDITMTLYVQSNFVATDVKAQVEAKIQEYLNPADFEFGDTVYMSRLYAIPFSVPGVSNATIALPTVDTTCGETQLPKIGTITITTSGGV